MSEASRRWAVSAAWCAAAAVSAAVAAVGSPADVAAQVRPGSYWLSQPHQSARVGLVWRNASGTVEYWAYVDGEYRWADTGNDSENLWHLRAERAAAASYACLDDFRSATCAMPEFQGKTLIFQSHVVSETVVDN